MRTTYYEILQGAVNQHAADRSRRLMRDLYGQLWRRYHNLDHIERVWGHKEFLRNSLEPQNPEALDLAICLHDIIYVPGRPGSEDASALLCESLGLGLLGWEAARLIRLTASHDPAPHDIDGILICDADLFELADPLCYGSNAAAIYDEVYDYTRQSGIIWDPDLWITGRTKWLTEFPQRERIFHSPHSELLEEAARQHLAIDLQNFTRALA